MAEPAPPLLRIAVVGTSGVGKSTLAKALAQQFGIPHTELDAINWQATGRACMKLM
jgi:adenylate kinase family enzyme